MSNTGGKVIHGFRDTFRVVQKDAVRWFPGHMGKGVKQMQKQLKNVDCIIEVHDARVPISGHYADYSKTLTGLKPHILVMNKMDLTNMKFRDSIRSKLHGNGVSEVLFTNFKSQKCKGTKQLLPLAVDLIKNSDRFNRSEESSYSIMVIGVPNVGKSSLINRLRNTHLKRSNAASVGSIPGITRSVSTPIKISQNPLVYVLDTPGILAPTIHDIESGLKLALVGCLQDHLVGPILLADYLLFWLNKHKHFQYVKSVGLNQPNDDILYVLSFIAAKHNMQFQMKNFDGSRIARPNLDLAANCFLSDFRKGNYGLHCLDQSILESNIKTFVKEEAVM